MKGVKCFLIILFAVILLIQVVYSADYQEDEFGKGSKPVDAKTMPKGKDITVPGSVYLNLDGGGNIQAQAGDTVGNYGDYVRYKGVGTTQTDYFTASGMQDLDIYSEGRTYIRESSTTSFAIDYLSSSAELKGIKEGDAVQNQYLKLGSFAEFKTQTFVAKSGTGADVRYMDGGGSDLGFKYKFSVNDYNERGTVNVDKPPAPPTPDTQKHFSPETFTSRFSTKASADSFRSSADFQRLTLKEKAAFQFAYNQHYSDSQAAGQAYTGDKAAVTLDKIDSFQTDTAFLKKGEGVEMSGNELYAASAASFSFFDTSFTNVEDLVAYGNNVYVGSGDLVVQAGPNRTMDFFHNVKDTTFIFENGRLKTVLAGSNIDNNQFIVQNNVIALMKDSRVQINYNDAGIEIMTDDRMLFQSLETDEAVEVNNSLTIINYEYGTGITCTMLGARSRYKYNSSMPRYDPFALYTPADAEYFYLCIRKKEEQKFSAALPQEGVIDMLDKNATLIGRYEFEKLGERKNLFTDMGLSS